MPLGEGSIEVYTSIAVDSLYRVSANTIQEYIVRRRSGKSIFATSVSGGHVLDFAVFAHPPC